MAADSQKLIAYGKVLEDEAKTLKDYSIKEGDFLVVMVSKVRFSCTHSATAQARRQARRGARAGPALDLACCPGPTSGSGPASTAASCRCSELTIFWGSEFVT